MNTYKTNQSYTLALRVLKIGYGCEVSSHTAITICSCKVWLTITLQLLSINSLRAIPCSAYITFPRIISALWNINGYDSKLHQPLLKSFIYLQDKWVHIYQTNLYLQEEHIANRHPRLFHLFQLLHICWCKFRFSVEMEIDTLSQILLCNSKNLKIKIH